MESGFKRATQTARTVSDHAQRAQDAHETRDNQTGGPAGGPSAAELAADFFDIERSQGPSEIAKQISAASAKELPAMLSAFEEEIMSHAADPYGAQPTNLRNHEDAKKGLKDLSESLNHASALMAQQHYFGLMARRNPDIQKADALKAIVDLGLNSINPQHQFFEELRKSKPDPEKLAELQDQIVAQQTKAAPSAEEQFLAELATNRANPETISRLLQGSDFLLRGAGAELNEVAVTNGKTPLQSAASQGLTDAIEALLKAPGIDPNKVDYQGNTALMFAVKNDQAGAIEALLKAEGTNIEAADQWGRTAMMLAAQAGDTQAVKTLLNAKADGNKADTYGRTPLILAATGGHAETIAALLSAQGVDVNQADKYGDTALATAVRYQNTRAVEALIKAEDIDIDKKNNNGKTPMQTCLDEQPSRARDAILQLLKSRSPSATIG